MRYRGTIILVGMWLGVGFFAAANSWAEHEMSWEDIARSGMKVRYHFVCSGTTCIVANQVCEDKGTVRPKTAAASSMGGAQVPAASSATVYKTIGPDELVMFGKEMDFPACR